MLRGRCTSCVRAYYTSSSVGTLRAALSFGTVCAQYAIHRPLCPLHCSYFQSLQQVNQLKGELVKMQVLTYVRHLIGYPRSAGAG